MLFLFLLLLLYTFTYLLTYLLTLPAASGLVFGQEIPVYELSSSSVCCALATIWLIYP